MSADEQNSSREKCTCSIRFMKSEGQPETYSTQIDFCPMHEAAENMLEALKAAVRYDDVVRKRGQDGEVKLDPLAAVAEGEDLDELYFDWVNKSREAITKAGMA